MNRNILDMLNSDTKTILFLIMCILRKINILQLERYGHHGEQRYRMKRLAIAIDPSYVSKAGNKTAHIGRFWSGCTSAVKYGLEILGIAVADADIKDAMMLKAVQTRKATDLKAKRMTLGQWYLFVLKKYKDNLLKITPLLVADTAFSNLPSVTGFKEIGFPLISRLRSNAVLYYIYEGPRTGKRGHPTTKNGKIDFANPDKSRMRRMDIEASDGEAYELIAWSKSFKQKIRLVIHYLPNGDHRLYFSTDISVAGTDVFDIYRTRFHFAYNASLAAVNITKVLRKPTKTTLSIGQIKFLMVNAHFIKRFFDVSGIDPYETLNAKLVKELFGFAADAA